MFVARTLHDAGMGTLLFDLLTPAEDRVYAARFDIPLLAERLAGATAWVRRRAKRGMRRSATSARAPGAGAALLAASIPGARVGAIVSRGGRPDLAGAQALARVPRPRCSSSAGRITK